MKSEGYSFDLFDDPQCEEKGDIMAGKSPKEKGRRGEREIVNILTKAGLKAHRVPLSGSVDGYPGDVIVDIITKEGPIPWTGEVKRRKDGFKELYKWLNDKDLIFCRADRKEWLVIMRLEEWIWLTKRKSSTP